MNVTALIIAIVAIVVIAAISVAWAVTYNKAASRAAIAEQLRLSEVWSVVRDTPNIRRIERILVEASYDMEGQQKLVALEADSDFPYCVTEIGMHLVRLN